MNNAVPTPTPLSHLTSLGKRAWVGLLGTAIGPLLGLLIVTALFWGADLIHAHHEDKPARFATVDSLQTVLLHTSRVGTAALGMTLIIIAGGIDLSAGTAIALSATVTAWFFRAEYHTAVGICAGLTTGCLAGLINGSLICALRVVPFIVTLGTMTIFRGIGRIIAEDTPIRAFGKVPDWLLSLQDPNPNPEWSLVSPGVWVMLLLAAVVGFILKLTVFGRHTIALGSNESTARLCGINVLRTRIAVYTFAGFFVGVAGLFQFTVLAGEGNPMAGTGQELNIIAAVVIGGGSLNGGRGSVLGTLSGAAIMAVIQHGCVLLNVPDSYQELIIGMIIIAAVTIDQLRQRRMSD